MLELQRSRCNVPMRATNNSNSGTFSRCTAARACRSCLIQYDYYQSIEYSYSHFKEQPNVVLPISFYEKDGNVLYNSIAVIDDGEAGRSIHIPDLSRKFYFHAFSNTGFKVWDIGAKIGLASVKQAVQLISRITYPTEGRTKNELRSCLLSRKITW